MWTAGQHLLVGQHTGCKSCRVFRHFLWGMGSHRTGVHYMFVIIVVHDDDDVGGGGVPFVESLPRCRGKNRPGGGRGSRSPPNDSLFTIHYL